jgi:cyclic beta-1,2-glucan synthetase
VGSQANTEAHIDLIAQAWAVLSDAAPPHPHKQGLAMAAVHGRIWWTGNGRSSNCWTRRWCTRVPSAGYIQAYPPGVRENGGQYAHAGVWALMAVAELAHAQPAGPRPTRTMFTATSPT